jgi:hypothetical protein
VTVSRNNFPAVQLSTSPAVEAALQIAEEKENQFQASVDEYNRSVAGTLDRISGKFMPGCKSVVLLCWACLLVWGLLAIIGLIYLFKKT